jgi:hypothetical protein
MHVFARKIPSAVIFVPETSLIWPAGHDPSSTRMFARDLFRQRRRGQSRQRETAEQQPKTQGL